jgi:cobyric acid synthase
VLGRPAAPMGEQWLRVAVVRLPHISNATDAEALATEPGVAGLGVAPVRVVFAPTKTLSRPHGTSALRPGVGV